MQFIQQDFKCLLSVDLLFLVQSICICGHMLFENRLYWIGFDGFKIRSTDIHTRTHTPRYISECMKPIRNLICLKLCDYNYFSLTNGQLKNWLRIQYFCSQNNGRICWILCQNQLTLFTVYTFSVNNLND